MGCRRSITTSCSSRSAFDLLTPYEKCNYSDEQNPSSADADKRDGGDAKPVGNLGIAIRQWVFTLVERWTAGIVSTVLASALAAISSIIVARLSQNERQGGKEGYKVATLTKELCPRQGARYSHPLGRSPGERLPIHVFRKLTAAFS